MVTTGAHEPAVGIRQRDSWVDSLRVLVTAGVMVVHTRPGSASASFGLTATSVTAAQPSISTSSAGG